MAEPLKTVPPEKGSELDSVQLRADLAELRVRFRMLDDVDLKTSELVGKLAETMQSLVELRARASLDISAALERSEHRIDAIEARQRELLQALRDEISSVQGSAAGLAQLAATIEANHRALQARIALHGEQESDDSPVQDQQSRPTELFPNSTGVTARVDTASRPTASTIVLRFDDVDSAVTALSLQRFVSRLPGVVAVTGRQFVGRTLKLDVNIRGDVLYDDLLDWPDGGLALSQSTDRGAVLTIVRMGRQ